MKRQISLNHVLWDCIGLHPVEDAAYQLTPECVSYQRINVESAKWENWRFHLDEISFNTHIGASMRLVLIASEITKSAPPPGKSIVPLTATRIKAPNIEKVWTTSKIEFFSNHKINWIPTNLQFPSNPHPSIQLPSSHPIKWIKLLSIILNQKVSVSIEELSSDLQRKCRKRKSAPQTTLSREYWLLSLDWTPTTGWR